MARGTFGHCGMIVAGAITAGAFAISGCFYPSYEVVTDGAAGGGTGGTGGSDGMGGAGGAGGAGSCAPVGTEDVLACDQANPSAIAVNFANIYWVNEGSGEIVKMSKMDKSITVIANNEDRPCGIALAPGAVFWRTRGGLIRKINFTPNAQIETLKEGLGDSCALSTDGMFLYFFNTSDTENPELFRTTLAGGPDLGLPAKPMPVGVAGQAGHIYWMEKSTKKLHIAQALNPMQQTDFEVTEPCGLAGSEQFVVVTSRIDKAVSVYANGAFVKTFTSMSAPCEAATAGGGIAWVTPSTGEVYAGAIAGNPAPKAKGPTPGCAVAIDGTDVYWTSCKSGAKTGRIMRVTVQ